MAHWFRNAFFEWDFCRVCGLFFYQFYGPKVIRPYSICFFFHNLNRKKIPFDILTANTVALSSWLNPSTECFLRIIDYSFMCYGTVQNLFFFFKCTSTFFSCFQEKWFFSKFWKNDAKIWNFMYLCHIAKTVREVCGKFSKLHWL